MLTYSQTENQFLTHPILEEKGIELAIKRLDLVHPEVSGNKFFKLKHNLEKAKTAGKTKIMTFGGAFSNHIYATAKAAQAENLEAIGIIRGERTEPLNYTLRSAEEAGMQLEFIDRSSYRNKTELGFLAGLSEKFGDFFLIPEGGTNEQAIKGTQEILRHKDSDFTHITTSIGTGGTFSGLFSTLDNHQKLLGFSALKGEFIHREIAELIEKYQLTSKGSYEIITPYHFGGYAKWKPELVELIRWFWEVFKIPLDPVYTGKMMFGLFDLINKNHFPKGSKILAIHSGGLQGNIGFEEMTGIGLPSV
ncbi:pyridoxal-phosphate dependent enzyme [Algoriphagus halophytocola]|uniref:1-aminocyclopropane-1-carboxylate deaminase/D-cysteine desulfhydrase n=1 Tax=Algoriphagus halophytocola TaxID=2991499 RepID=UPI0022DE71B5|nr:pyridoxal-phosphate dependent enzyme [Algoriphagus sp. TR-M9]WBL43071.1 pyridoxal-phosphate dependent enzyme [Algoriphagus sp. TR-M9]